MNKKLKVIASSLMLMSLLIAPSTTYAKSPDLDIQTLQSVDTTNISARRGFILDQDKTFVSDVSHYFYFGGSGEKYLDFNIINKGNTRLGYMLFDPEGVRVLAYGPLEPGDSKPTFDIRLPITGRYKVYVYNYDVGGDTKVGTVRFTGYAY